MWGGFRTVWVGWFPVGVSPCVAHVKVFCTFQRDMIHTYVCTQIAIVYVGTLAPLAPCYLTTTNYVRCFVSSFSLFVVIKDPWETIKLNQKLSSVKTNDILGWGKRNVVFVIEI